MFQGRNLSWNRDILAFLNQSTNNSFADTSFPLSIHPGTLHPYEQTDKYQNDNTSDHRSLDQASELSIRLFDRKNENVALIICLSRLFTAAPFSVSPRYPYYLLH